MEKKDELISIFSKNIRQILALVSVDFDQVQEIRLRVAAPLLMVYQNEEYYVNAQGGLSRDQSSAYLVTKPELKETMEYMSSYSLYAFEEEMKQGFLTIQGGHRIGIAGKTILDAAGIKTMKYISFINVRLSHQVKGCASFVLPYLYKEGGNLPHFVNFPSQVRKNHFTAGFDPSDFQRKQGLWGDDGRRGGRAF